MLRVVDSRTSVTESLPGVADENGFDQIAKLHELAKIRGLTEIPVSPQLFHFLSIARGIRCRNGDDVLFRATGSAAYVFYDFTASSPRQVDVNKH